MMETFNSFSRLMPVIPVESLDCGLRDHFGFFGLWFFCSWITDYLFFFLKKTTLDLRISMCLLSIFVTGNLDALPVICSTSTYLE